MEVAKLSAPPNHQVRSVSCNESAIKRWLSSELEETDQTLDRNLNVCLVCLVSGVLFVVVVVVVFYLLLLLYNYTAP